MISKTNIKPDPFIAGLILMILLAWLIPGIGMGDYKPDLGMVIDTGVFMIFFLYGLKLDPEKIRRGLRNFRMHLAIHLTTFLVFPLLILPFYPFFKETAHEILWMGMFFLAVLPSTVSSSVVMVGIAGGNIPGAIFNASISGLIGILVTPLWMGLFLAKSGEPVNLSTVIIQLVTQIFLPVILGLILHRFLGKWVNRHIRQLAWFDKTIILLIVYESFSKSFLSGLFSDISLVVFTVLFSCVVALFFVVFSFTRSLSRWLRFNREDSITLQFAGSKKSLVHGTVFASVLFSGISGTGVLLLPIMIYHAFQLSWISFVAGRMQRAHVEKTT